MILEAYLCWGFISIGWHGLGVKRVTSNAGWVPWWYAVGVDLSMCYSILFDNYGLLKWCDNGKLLIRKYGLK